MIRDTMEHVIADVTDGNGLEATVLAYALERQGIEILHLEDGEVTQRGLLAAIENLGAEARRQQGFATRAERWATTHSTKRQEAAVELKKRTAELAVAQSEITRLQLDKARLATELEREKAHHVDAVGRMATQHDQLRALLPLVVDTMMWAQSKAARRASGRLRQIRDAALERAKATTQNAKGETP